MVAPNICGVPQHGTRLHVVTLLAHKLLRNLQDFWEICAPTIYVNGVNSKVPTAHRSDLNHLRVAVNCKKGKGKVIR